jgi:hypothetical protein
VIDALAAFPADIFGRPGLTLHGETKVRKRKTLVTDMFFVLSLKAGGSGFTLMAASHVCISTAGGIRRSRIRRICRLRQCRKEDRQADRPERSLSAELLGGSGEVNLTQLSNDEIL